MDYTTLVIILSIMFVCFHLLKSFFTTPSSHKLPPGPKPIPIFGNIFYLGEKPHRSFANLAKIHGPLISLKLGSVTTIVVSSSYVAEEMFLKHDRAFANRTIPDSIRACDHDKLSMSWLPISLNWRNLRKISSVQLLSNQRLDASQAHRQAQVEQLLAYVQDCSIKGIPVDIGRAAFTTSLNLLSNTFFSVELASHESSASQEFKQLMWNIMEEIGKPNYADYFPILAYVDPFGVRRRLAAYFDQLIDVFQDIIKERQKIRLKNGSSAKQTNDILDTLLNLHDENELSMGEINHLLVDIFNAGTDTTASTLEWAMTELVRNPRIMGRVQHEIEQALEKDCSSIQEAYILKLPYLQAIIKETLRLHPPTVFLLPRKANIEVELHGFTVPKNAQILVNLWAVGRDPKVWENPKVFIPDRFLECDIDVKGQNFELLPFGAGRRICPGLGLAYRMLNLILATLIHNYDWKLEDGMNVNDLDMDEKFGITLQKVVPLKVIPVPRNS
ncbi:cytochrome P450 76AD1-like [Spinacia oleracea]|uniref:Cytochrome P450 76AD1-like n=1 Tax=Spinacia oleracea TaxID=3562 RepID=A0A9R0IFH3_SPIOL|nr:cytochrome P450 76AD1-like [Spinacia oleracea]